MLEGLGVLSVKDVGRPRTREGAVTKKSAVSLTKSALRVVGDALSNSRRRSLEAAQRRLVQFRNNWHEATGVLLSWDLAIIYWVERQRSRTKGPISNSSALEYVGRAQAALRRTGASSVGGQMLIDYMRALKRATAETGDTCGGGAGAGCVAKGGRRRYAAGYRAVLGGRGESVGR